MYNNVCHVNYKGVKKGLNISIPFLINLDYLYLFGKVANENMQIQWHRSGLD